jgi:ABC-2 type transport system permease protein
MHDLKAVIWKEWRELLAQSELGVAATLAIAVPLLLVVGLVAALAGPEIVKTPLFPFICTFAPLAAIAGTVCESFAGERERHTLETLLATRLTTESMLFGKILVQVLYGWAAALLLFAVFILGANARTLGNGFVWPSAAGATQVLAITPLLLGVVATTGALFSLRAATVRQAQSRSIVTFMGIFIATVITARLVPREMLLAARESLQSPSQQLLVAAVWVATLFAANVGLFLAALARFQRHRLIEIR